ncbi:hypothetical protein DRE_06453 [Drechslerella stenobrocha 248]|uniref:Uncharacterized protein n=1 Tax=Drechslerella stenobrocha 248 TaxID=1043628 RepID=W7I767_9PEZI|nr:hypothetical protein DRE_06453 [Drechslerella stenobrocha 248]
MLTSQEMSDFVQAVQLYSPRLQIVTEDLKCINAVTNAQIELLHKFETTFAALKTDISGSLIFGKQSTRHPKSAEWAQCLDAFLRIANTIDGSVQSLQTQLNTAVQDTLDLRESKNRLIALLYGVRAVSSDENTRVAEGLYFDKCLHAENEIKGTIDGFPFLLNTLKDLTGELQDEIRGLKEMLKA